MPRNAQTLDGNIEQNSFFFRKAVASNFETTVGLVRDSMAAEGFGVLTEIDLAATMRNKLGKETPPYLILGTCNPGLAWEAMGLEPWIGIEMPCNVVVRQLDNGKVEVAIKNPVVMIEMSDSEDIPEMSSRIREIILRVLSNLN